MLDVLLIDIEGLNMHRFTCASHEDCKFEIAEAFSTVFFFSYLLEASDKNVMLIKKKSFFFNSGLLLLPVPCSGHVAAIGGNNRRQNCVKTLAKRFA